MPHSPNQYIGRFAPTPSGPLHSGSLVAALASFLDARSQQGKWLVRIENIDPPREQPGASDEILRALEAHQLYWDDQIVYQHERFDQYREIAHNFVEQGRAYYCTCSRQQLKNHRIYLGSCRHCQKKPAQAAAIRILCQPCIVSFDDGIQGPQQWQMAQDIGDFIIYRKDHLPAYQLATAFDDLEQKITHVVRGCDLLDSTPRQIHLHQLLGRPSPSYAHLPVLAKADGQKLSKQNLATQLNLKSSSSNLFKALNLLNQQPPIELAGADCEEILAWAITHWQRQNIPAVALIKQSQPDF